MNVSLKEIQSCPYPFDTNGSFVKYTDLELSTAAAEVDQYRDRGYKNPKLGEAVREYERRKSWNNFLNQINHIPTKDVEFTYSSKYRGILFKDILLFHPGGKRGPIYRHIAGKNVTSEQTKYKKYQNVSRVLYHELNIQYSQVGETIYGDKVNGKMTYGKYKTTDLKDLMKYFSLYCKATFENEISNGTARLFTLMKDNGLIVEFYTMLKKHGIDLLNWGVLEDEKGKILKGETTFNKFFSYEDDVPEVKVIPKPIEEPKKEPIFSSIPSEPSQFPYEIVDGDVNVRINKRENQFVVSWKSKKSKYNKVRRKQWEDAYNVANNAIFSLKEHGDGVKMQPRKFSNRTVKSKDIPTKKVEDEKLIPVCVFTPQVEEKAPEVIQETSTIKIENVSMIPTGGLSSNVGKINKSEPTQQIGLFGKIKKSIIGWLS